MEELLLTIVRGIVDSPEQARVTIGDTKEDGTIVYHISVAEEDTGKIIGKQGKIAKAIRTIARTAAIRNNTKVIIDIN